MKAIEYCSESESESDSDEEDEWFEPLVLYKDETPIPKVNILNIYDMNLCFLNIIQDQWKKEWLEEEDEVKERFHEVKVDGVLAKFLRPHQVLNWIQLVKQFEQQREGVQFMFECVMGLREYNGNGCILGEKFYF